MKYQDPGPPYEGEGHTFAVRDPYPGGGEIPYIQSPDVPPGAPRAVAGPAVAELTLEHLTAWLIERVAVYLRRDPSEIDPREPLAEYGLDSVAALSLCGDVEEDFDVILDPTAAWDHPTATAFAEHVLKELTSATGRP